MCVLKYHFLKQGGALVKTEFWMQAHPPCLAVKGASVRTAVRLPAGFFIPLRKGRGNPFLHRPLGGDVAKSKQEGRGLWMSMLL